MKIIYLIAALLFYGKMLFITGSAVEPLEEVAVVETLLEQTGAPNVVSGIIFRNRLYDTMLEVVVFTIAIMGVRFLMAEEKPAAIVYQVSDAPSVVLARLGAMIALLIGIELAIRGHLSPGGGFAAGVAGGTAIGLVAIISSPEWLHQLYEKWQAAKVEKLSVLVFLVLAALSLLGINFPLDDAGWIPLLNMVVALKVAIGSWGAILVFIRYRGLL